MFANQETSIEPHDLGSMARALIHRGPDAEGFFVEPGIALAHRRLSIIDLSGGDQPIANEDGSVQVVFNGEIYNYQELRQELVSKGHRFRTCSDTEVLVHLYEEVGSRLVERLRGMFAFAMWDRRRRTLLLARDRLGIKPLHVYRDGEKVLFGSELKAILAYPGVRREIDPKALEDYLTLSYVPGPRTIYRGIEKLPPGCLLEVSPERLNAPVVRYWRFEIAPDDRPTADEWCEEIRAKLDESVRLHTIADVRVGAFLSGGIDSSVLVALAARQSAEPIWTFSLGFAEESFSELPFARMVAVKYGTQHVEQVVTPDAVELLDELSVYYDEPFADASAVPTFLVSRLAAQHVKVVLYGDGGDEAFGGYSRYAHDLREFQLRQKLPAWIRQNAIGRLGEIWPKSDWLPRPLRWKTALTNLGLDASAAYANTMTRCRVPLRRQLIRAEIASALNGHDPLVSLRQWYESAPGADALGSMISADVGSVLPDDFLVKVDRASMACGLEVRTPLLDHEFFELAARIPSRYKVRDQVTKWIFRKAYEPELPAGLRNRPKQGFDIPLDAWLRGPLASRFEDMVLSGNSSVGGLVDQQVVRNLFAAHCSGRSRMGEVLWSLLILALWSEKYLGKVAGSSMHAG